jgi:hypothetical protein
MEDAPALSMVGRFHEAPRLTSFRLNPRRAGRFMKLCGTQNLQAGKKQTKQKDPCYET